jgi:hypothetical protein
MYIYLAAGYIWPQFNCLLSLLTAGHGGLMVVVQTFVHGGYNTLSSFTGRGCGVGACQEWRFPLTRWHMAPHVRSLVSVTSAC